VPQWVDTSIVTTATAPLRHFHERNPMPNTVICAYARSPFTPANKGELAKNPSRRYAGAGHQRAAGQIKSQSRRYRGFTRRLRFFPKVSRGLIIARHGRVSLPVLPITVAGATVNRFCGSSMEAVAYGCGARLPAVAGEVFICCRGWNR